MESQIKRYGYDLALTIPPALALAMGLRVGSVVHLTIAANKLVITPQPEPSLLDEMLAGITPQNLPAEHDFGPAAGREVW